MLKTIINTSKLKALRKQNKTNRIIIIINKKHAYINKIIIIIVITNNKNKMK